MSARHEVEKTKLAALRRNEPRCRSPRSGQSCLYTTRMRRKEACDDERYSKKPFSWIAATENDEHEV